MRSILTLALLTALIFSGYAQKKINVGTELQKLNEIRRLPQYWEDTRVKQFSSYDTTGNNDDGFSGKYSFIRKEGKDALVIFEAEGNGVIHRIWTPTPTEDTLDFYFGGNKNPSFSIRFSDLFSGKQYPFISPLSGNEIGGYFCYFPIPFADGCKIVFRGDKLQFYQIQYRTYPKTYKVESFALPLKQQTKAQLADLQQSWNQMHSVSLEGRVISSDTTLLPGQPLTIAEISGGGRITGLTLAPAEAFEGPDKTIFIKITWDDEKQAAVNMPVADFFGYAFGSASMQSLLLGSNENVNYCYFPMPFDRKARVQLVYHGSGKKTVGIQSNVHYSDEKRDRSTEGKFYAHWNRNFNPPLGEPHVLLAGEGKGHYVGTILQTQGLKPGMTLFFEGDDITIIDGEMTIHGTGSEDYFNGGWYALLNRWDREMSLPLHGSLDYSLPFARTGGYRLFIADKMPFERQIVHTIEHGPENNNMPVDYTSVAFYYADKPVSTQQPSQKIRAIHIPDTLMIYPQLMQYSFAGAVTVDGSFLQSSRGGHVRIDLGDIPKGEYKLYGDIEQFPDGAEISIWQRQQPVSGDVSFSADKRSVQSNFFLSNIKIDDFRDSITLRFKPDEKRNKIRIHRLILVRQSMNAATQHQ